MADFENMDRFWEFFTEMKILYRNISLLSLIMFPLTYQIIAVEFFVEEESDSACNYGGRCIHPDHSVVNGSNWTMPTVKSYTEVDFYDSGTLLITTHYVSMLLGVLILGLAADKFGRRRILFCSLTFAFCSSILGAVLIQNIPVFVPFMMVSGFTSGLMILFCSLTFAFCSSILGAVLIQNIPVFVPFMMVSGFTSGASLVTIFVLAAEYVNPGRRPLFLAAIWLASTLSCISFSGLAFIVESRKMLMVAISLPLLMMILLFNIIPESPRWVLLQTTYPVQENDESQTLLHRFVSEEQCVAKSNGCCPLSCGNEKDCFGFLWMKERRRTVLVVALAWFSIGMLYRGLNTTSIQLLKNFYSNYAVRELINLPAFLCQVFFVTCAGRRITTMLGMVMSGILCVMFSAASDGFLLSEYRSTTIVIQLLGRFFVVLSMTSLGLYSIELFPTIVRCSAVGLVTSCSFLGAAVTPLFMKFQALNPIIPLAILGSFSLLSGVLLRVFLPETKGSMTAETLEDTVVGRTNFNRSWTPNVHVPRRELRHSSDGESLGDSRDSRPKSPAEDKRTDEFKDLSRSWEVSFDRASCTSKWEWLSYEDARRKLPSLDIEISLRDESHLLDEDDLNKLSKHVAGNSWILLYSTYSHGISLKTLYHRLEDVETPVLLAVKDNKEYVFGVYSPTTPKIHPGFHGYGKSFFYTCKPKYKMFPCSGKNEYYLSGETDSLAFGCSHGMFGLWLDSELYRGRSTACETYNSEMLSASEDFICIGLEAWTFA